MILVGISSCWQDFLLLRSLIIFSTSLQLVFLKGIVESNVWALILTLLGGLSKDLITGIIGSRLLLAIGKGFGFGMLKVGITLEKNWLNVSQSSSSLHMVLLPSMRLIFSLFDEFWVNNGRTVLQKLLFQIKFLSVFQKFFKEIFWGAVGFFC